MAAPPRFHFFSGKGGVGKTTCATAAAIAAAEEGRRVLLVSTDPAHSLGDALDAKIGAKPRRVPVRKGSLHALELDADAALARWLDERRATLAAIAERGTYLDRDDVERFLSLSLPGVDELVGLLELVRVARAGDFEAVVVDTAPTGHTLRLLAMPETLRRLAVVFDDMQEKHRLVAASLGGRYRPDRSDALIAEIDAEGKELGALLRDRERVRFSWVLLPEDLSVAEAHDGLAALDAAGIAVDECIVNRVTPKPRTRCAFCEARRRAEAAAIAKLRTKASVRVLPAVASEPRGVAALRRLRPGTPSFAQRGRIGEGATKWRGEKNGAIAIPASLKLLLFGGKGGTGKTTCAAATALSLARADRSRRVLLLSTDPAHSLGDALRAKLGDAPVRIAKNLDARELDAEAAFAARRERFHDAVDELFDALRGGSNFDETYDRAVARDLIELAPPGIDELFAVLSVLDELLPEQGAPRHDLVVLDTAPSGHALRLLEMPESAQEWVKTLLQVILKYRSVTGLGRLTEDLVALARGLRRLRATLADPALARFVTVTRAAALPRLETERLVGRLAELGVATPTVIVNALTPEARPLCAGCRGARAREARELAALERSLGGREGARAILVARAVAPPPRGAKALEEWARTWQPR